jgi:hypothetical protein
VHWAPGISHALCFQRADDFLDNLGHNMPRERNVMSATELATVIARLIVQGVSDFVQINLNRFTSLPGYLNSAHEAGRHTFAEDPDYLWYGMVLRKM